MKENTSIFMAYYIIYGKLVALGLLLCKLHHILLIPSIARMFCLLITIYNLKLFLILVREKYYIFVTDETVL